MNEAAATVQVMAETIVLLRREKDDLMTQLKSASETNEMLRERLGDLERQVEEIRDGE